MTNVTDIDERFRKGKTRIEQSRERVASWTKATVTHLRHVGPFMEARADERNDRANIKMHIHNEILKAYSRFSFEEASQIVSEAHEEVRRSKGVQS